MELKQYETFEEFPFAILKVDENNDNYYVENDGKKYIAWKNNDVVENLDSDGNKIKYTIGYYNVLDGKRIATTISISDDEKIINETKNVKVYPLKEILNIKENSIYELTRDDVVKFSKFKEENKYLNNPYCKKI